MPGLMLDIDILNVIDKYRMMFSIVSGHFKLHRHGYCYWDESTGVNSALTSSIQRNLAPCVGENFAFC